MTTLELPTDIWDTIVKQSIQSTQDKVKALSTVELTEIIKFAQGLHKKKLIEDCKEFACYSVIIDDKNQKWMIMGHVRNKHLKLFRVSFTTNVNIFGNYQFYSTHINENNAIFDLEDRCIYYRGDKNVMANWIDEVQKQNGNMKRTNFVSIIHRQKTMDVVRTDRANLLKVGDEFKYFITQKFNSYDTNDVGKAQVYKIDKNYIYGEYVDDDVIRRMKTEKRYIY
jgi:hypothetical protein